MQPDSRKEEQPIAPRKDVTERKRRFQIVKLEERIAPGGRGGPDSFPSVGGGIYCPHHTRRVHNCH
jgi:hypothetical protein